MSGLYSRKASQEIPQITGRLVSPLYYACCLKKSSSLTVHNIWLSHEAYPQHIMDMSPVVHSSPIYWSWTSGWQRTWRAVRWLTYFSRFCRSLWFSKPKTIAPQIGNLWHAFILAAADLHLFNAIQYVCNQQNYWVFLGDFDAPKIDCTVNLPISDGSYELALVDAIDENMLIQHVRTPTHFRSEQKPSLLDLVLTKYPDCITSFNQ